MSPEPAQATPVDASASARARRRADLRAELAQRVGTYPGWRLLESEHYFVMTSVSASDLEERMAQRLEAFLARCSADFPATHDAPFFGKVLLFATRESFEAYGSPPGSTAYFDGAQGEVVVHAEPDGELGRSTWANLRGMLFHQWFQHACPGAMAHPWFSLGTADFYAGLRETDSGLELAPFEARRKRIQEQLRSDEHVPLQRFVRFDAREYDGFGDLRADIASNYAQGWSLVWYLSTGSRAAGWNPAWSAILPTYQRSLCVTGDRDQSLEWAFAGVDFAELEARWKATILALGPGP